MDQRRGSLLVRRWRGFCKASTRKGSTVNPFSPITTAAVSGGGVVKDESMRFKGDGCFRRLRWPQLRCLTPFVFLSLLAAKREGEGQEEEENRNRSIDGGEGEERQDLKMRNLISLSFSREGKVNERERKLYISSSFLIIFFLFHLKYISTHYTLFLRKLYTYILFVYNKNKNHRNISRLGTWVTFSVSDSV